MLKAKFMGLLPRDMHKHLGASLWFHVPSEIQIDVTEWCFAQFGSSGSAQDGYTAGDRWVSSGGTFVVYEEDDAFSFRLRWC